MRAHPKNLRYLPDWLKTYSVSMDYIEKRVINGCRCGEITFPNKGASSVVETPCCLLYTRGGAVPHLTNDLVDQLLGDANYGIQITLPTTFQNPGPEVVNKFEKGIGNYLDHKQKFVYCSINDPAQEIQCTYNEEKTISVWNSSGRKKVNIDHFMEIITAFKPDIVECLCDTVPDKQTPKRNRKSVDRTLKFLDDVVKRRANNEALSKISLLGAIVGGDSRTERERCIKETSKRPVSGFVVEGIDLSSENGKCVLGETTKILPTDKVCFFSGVASPDDIFHAMECGVNVFDSCFAYEVTKRDCALDLRYGTKRYKPDTNQPICEVTNEERPPTSNQPTIVENLITTQTRFEISLSSERYKEDFSPLAMACCCYSCRTHTRAYVYHLLQTKEMLAQVLLSIHNFHQYFAFFENLRQALKNGDYENYKNYFTQH